MSQYAPIWEALKSNYKCELAVPLSRHKRVIKAVIRSKDRDVIFKLQASMANKRYKLRYTREGAKITFYLDSYFVLKSITGADL